MARRTLSPSGTGLAGRGVWGWAERCHGMDRGQAPGFLALTRSSVALRSAPLTWMRP
jgi:hypothetical protein